LSVRRRTLFSELRLLSSEEQQTRVKRRQ
jgi:hypothetical protein